MKILRGVTDNPVLTLELSRSPWRRFWLVLMLSGAVMFIGTGLAFNFDVTRLLPIVGVGDFTDGERTWEELFLGYSPLWLMNWLTPVYVLARLALPLLTAPSITAERERGALDALLLTHLSYRSIVWGKGLAACLPFAVLLGGAVMGTLLSGLMVGFSSVGPALPAVFVYIGVVLSSSMAGVAVSALVPRTYYAYVFAPLASLVMGGALDYIGGLVIVYYISSGGWALGIESIPEGVYPFGGYRFPMSHHILALTLCAAVMAVANIAAACLFAVLAAKRLEKEGSNSK